VARLKKVETKVCAWTLPTRSTIPCTVSWYCFSCSNKVCGVISSSRPSTSGVKVVVTWRLSVRSSSCRWLPDSEVKSTGRLKIR